MGNHLRSQHAASATKSLTVPILTLEKTYGRARLEAACQRAAQIKARSASSVRSILQSGLDRGFLEPEPDHEPLRHGNIRGRNYFH